MALFNIEEIQDLGRGITFEFRQNINHPKYPESRNYSASQIIDYINEETEKNATHFDIFLCHSFKDAEIVLGLLMELKSMGYIVYVDWIIDPFLDREKVSAATADKLRKRLIQSDSLFYATTENAPNSKWMPWELGFKDGQNGLIAILPVSNEKNSNNQYNGQEYLGLYPYVVKVVNN